MLGLKLNHVSKRGHSSSFVSGTGYIKHAYWQWWFVSDDYSSILHQIDDNLCFILQVHVLAKPFLLGNYRDSNHFEFIYVQRVYLLLNELGGDNFANVCPLPNFGFRNLLCWIQKKLSCDQLIKHPVIGKARKGYKK